MLVTPKLEQVFLHEVPNSMTRIVVVEANDKLLVDPCANFSALQTGRESRKQVYF